MQETIHEEGYDENAFVAATTDDPNDTSMVQAEDGGEEQDISESVQTPVKVDTEDAGEKEIEAGATEEKASDALEKTVPYGALHAEREMRKETQQQLAETQRLLGQMEGLKEQLQELRQGKQGEDTTQDEQDRFEEEFEEDPIGALRKQNEALRARLDAEDSNKQEQQQTAEEQAKQQQQLEEFMGDVTKQVAEFEKGHPDYPDAFKHLMDLRVAEYKTMGINDPQRLEMMFNQEAISLAQGAIANGKNPAEVAYEMAKVRGYTKSAGGSADNGKSGETLEQQMERLEKGAKASSTLTGGGSAGSDKLSLTDISTMSDKEFDALWANMEAGSIHE